MSISFYVPDAGLGGIDEYTKLMLHMDGADDGIVFTDDSASSHTITRNGLPVTKTAIKQFGTASGYWAGTPGFSGYYLQTPTGGTDWNFGTGDFTIDMWLYLPSLTNPGNSSPTILPAVHVSHTTHYIGVYASYGSKLFVSINGTLFQASGAPPTNEWFHAAVVRESGNVTLYQGGVSVDSGAYAGSLDFTATGFSFGRDMWNNYLAGYMDELRISKGTARWTTDFTPETGPYTT